VVLVSLLADQFSSQFIMFFGWPKKKLPILKTGHFLLSTLLIFFVQSTYQRVTNFQIRLDKKFKRVDKKKFRSLRMNNLFCGRPKKREIDRTIGWPKRLTKTTWMSLMDLQEVMQPYNDQKTVTAKSARAHMHSVHCTVECIYGVIT
jgi:hypothetical protein